MFELKDSKRSISIYLQQGKNTSAIRDKFIFPFKLWLSGAN